MAKKVRKRDVWSFTWWDIEGDESWGDDGSDLPLCVTLGFIVKKPNKKDKLPYWRIAGSWSEEQPGGVTKIPDCVVKNRKKLGPVDIPWR